MSVLLLLHAFPLDARMWEGQVPVLEQAGYEVIAPNLPGAEPDASIPSWAGRILELLPGDFIPVGISMGGYLAFELWRQAPKRIPALVLADTRANADDEGGRAARDETIRLLREEGFDAFWEGLAPKLFSAGASAEVVDGARAIAGGAAHREPGRHRRGAPRPARLDVHARGHRRARARPRRRG